MNAPMVNQDEEHLRLLAIFHYVVGGIMALFSCFGLIYVLMGMVFVFSPQMLTQDGNAVPPPPFMGWFFFIFGAVIVLIGWTMSVLVIVAGRSLAKRRRYLFCLIIAGMACLFMPFGTVLGVFTIIVLNRPMVKALFGSAASLS